MRASCRSTSAARRCRTCSPSQNRQVSIENIQKTVADYYKIKVSEMYSKKRTRNVARPRQVAMALAKELTQLSLPDIGEAFGGRDHTTVLHACRKIASLRKQDTGAHARLPHPRAGPEGMRTLCMPLEQAVGKSPPGVRGRFCPQSSTPAPQLARTASHGPKPRPGKRIPGLSTESSRPY